MDTRTEAEEDYRENLRIEKERKRKKERSLAQFRAITTWSKKGWRRKPVAWQIFNTKKRKTDIIGIHSAIVSHQEKLVRS